MSDHREFVDALREVLGLAPLYCEDKGEPLWDTHYFHDGNRRRCSLPVDDMPDYVPDVGSMVSEIYQRSMARLERWQFARPHV